MRSRTAWISFTLFLSTVGTETSHAICFIRVQAHKETGFVQGFSRATPAQPLIVQSVCACIASLTAKITLAEITLLERKLLFVNAAADQNVTQTRSPRGSISRRIIRINEHSSKLTWHLKMIAIDHQHLPKEKDFESEWLFRKLSLHAVSDNLMTFPETFRTNRSFVNPCNPPIAKQWIWEDTVYSEVPLIKVSSPEKTCSRYFRGQGVLPMRLCLYISKNIPFAQGSRQGHTVNVTSNSTAAERGVQMQTEREPLRRISLFPQEAPFCKQQQMESSLIGDLCCPCRENHT